jgi:hypothetical protein
VTVALTPTARVRARVRDCRYGGWGDKVERGGGRGMKPRAEGERGAGWLPAACGVHDGWRIVRGLERSVRGRFCSGGALAGPLSLLQQGVGVPLCPKLVRPRRRTLLGCVGVSSRRWLWPEGEGRARCSTGCRDRPLA